MSQTGQPQGPATDALPANMPADMPATAAPVSPPAGGFDPASLPLKDIHLPEPVSWWPPAPGWWLLLIAALLATAAVFLLYRWYRSRALQREIEAALQQIEQQFQQQGDPLALTQALSVLLRRAAISLYPQAYQGAERFYPAIAGLTGEDWLRFLDDSMSASNKDTSSFVSDTGRLLLQAPYLPPDDHGISEQDARQLLQLAGRWLRSRHRPAGKQANARAPADRQASTTHRGATG